MGTPAEVIAAGSTSSKDKDDDVDENEDERKDEVCLSFDIRNEYGRRKIQKTERRRG